MRRFIPKAYNTYLQGRTDSLFGEDDLCLRPRAFIVGAFLSFFLAVGAPYANMIIRGTYMARDFSTPGAIALFLLLVGPINAASNGPAEVLAVPCDISGCIGAAFFYSYSGLSTWDVYSPGSHFFLKLLLLSLGSVWASAQGRGGFALNRNTRAHRGIRDAFDRFRPLCHGAERTNPAHDYGHILLCNAGK